MGASLMTKATKQPEKSRESKKYKRGENPASLANLRPQLPGEPSRNPSGRPKSKPITDCIKKIGELSVKDLTVKETDTNYMAMAKSIVKESLVGKTKVQAFESVANRVEGRPAQPLSGPEGGPLQLSIEEIGDHLSEIFSELEAEDSPAATRKTT